MARLLFRNSMTECVIGADEVARGLAFCKHAAALFETDGLLGSTIHKETALLARNVHGFFDRRPQPEGRTRL
jgi:hypothetical protein